MLQASVENRILRRNLSVLEMYSLPLPEMSQPTSLITDFQIRIVSGINTTSCSFHFMIIFLSFYIEWPDLKNNNRKFIEQAIIAVASVAIPAGICDNI